ncbi:MAG: CDC48 family AAA ATPase [Candidatus Aenigmatarchaeota archaeon]
MELKLRVGELTAKEEAFRGLVRIDLNNLVKIGVREGEIVEIEGKRKTAAIALKAYPADIGLDIIRMDGITRRNAGVAVGEFVTVRKAEVKEAKKVVLAPAEAKIITAHPHYLKQSLLRRPLVKGDIIVPNPVSRRDEFLEALFGFDIEDFFFSPFPQVRLYVVNTEPSGIVVVTENTVIELLRERPKALEIEERGIPRVTWEDIGDLQEVKQKLREMIELPIRHPEVFERLGIDPPKGVLLYGPPGTGKTLLAKAVANESGAYFISISGPEVTSKWFGESEKKLRDIFEEASKNAPSIIFIDEIDAIAPKREEVVGEVEKRIVAQLLALMDGLKERGRVIVIGATNRPNALDPALRRPGRFDREIEVPPPDVNGRYEILVIHTRNMPINPFVKHYVIEELKEMNREDLIKKVEELKDENEIRMFIYKELEKEAPQIEKKLREKMLRWLAEITHGYVGADLAALAREAAMHALRRALPEIQKFKEEEEIPKEVLEKLFVTKEDFEYALKIVQPSAMREVFVEVPKVRWQDIGGLEEVKQALREAVEWPLKYRKYYEALGIKPPRGILLYGPPGTGKTLLAKAVATESGANFIAIKGPEIFCLDGNVPIISSLCGLEKISKFYEKVKEFSEVIKDKNLEILVPKKEILVPSLNNKTRVKKVYKLFVENVIKLKIEKNSQEIIVSANQPFLAYKNNEIKWIRAGELEEGDYIAYPVKIPSFNLEINLEVPKYKHLRIVKEDEDYYYVKIFSSKSITRLPKKLNEDVAEFLGWFAAEGSISKEKKTVYICNGNEENIKRIVELFSIFVDKERIKVDRKGKRVIVHSMPLIVFLEKIFEQNLERKARKVKVPSIIFKANEKIISAFLKGLYRGDGHIRKTKIELGTMSKNLARGVSYLLTILGIRHRVWKSNAYFVSIYGEEDIKEFLEKVFGEKRSFRKRKYYNARLIVPDVSSILRELKNKYNLRYEKELPEGLFEAVISKRTKARLKRLRNMIKVLEKFVKENDLKVLKFIVESPILWTRIVKKEKAEPRFMYDLETEDGIFVGGYYPLLLHNSKFVGESERMIREIFRKAREVAPCVIFIDEIDAIAPMRGLEVGTRVTENVVAQLLTEMSGIQELKDVVVIAATNRPDILDPAILRPGRFDRLIYVPPPDEKARLEILKIHTRNVPLAKDVDLKEIARKTENYSGADLEALVREAAILALREAIEKNKDPKEVRMKHFEIALEKVKPSISKEMIEFYKRFEERMKKRLIEEKERKEKYIG